MIIERHVDRREVLIHFIAIEEGKRPANYEMKSTKELEDIVTRQCYGKGTNPFGIYLVGKESDWRNKDIGEWVLALLPSEELYSCGVDNKWNPCLKKNKGNLLAVVIACPDLLHADKQPDLSEISEIIVTVKQIKSEKIGQFEVIDGFHRAIRQIDDGKKLLRSYVGLQN